MRGSELLRALPVRLDVVLECELRAFRAATLRGVDLVILIGLMDYALLLRCEGQLLFGSNCHIVCLSELRPEEFPKVSLRA